MTTLINMTPHTIKLADEAGNIVRELPSVGSFRLASNRKLVDMVDGFPVSMSGFMLPPEMPPAVEGIYYIVSTPAASMLQRKDYLAPDTGHSAIRERGVVVAVRGFVTF